MAHRRHSVTGPVTIPADPRVVDRSRSLLERADALFDSASAVTDSAERFRQFYLAALRGAGAALTVREADLTARSRRGSPNAWRRLRTMVPELTEAAEYFAGRSVIRSEIESGLRREVGAADCAEIRRRTGDLLDFAESLIIAYEQGSGGSADPDVRHSA